MHMKTHFPTISFYLNLQINNFLKTARLIYTIYINIAALGTSLCFINFLGQVDPTQQVEDKDSTDDDEAADAATEQAREVGGRSKRASFAVPRSEANSDSGEAPGGSLSDCDGSASTSVAGMRFYSFQ